MAEPATAVAEKRCRVNGPGKEIALKMRHPQCRQRCHLACGFDPFGDGHALHFSGDSDDVAHNRSFCRIVFDIGGKQLIYLDVARAEAHQVVIIGIAGTYVTGSDLLIDGGATAAYKYGELRPQ
ncbi:hypothetical protein EDF82_0899 [Raoultella sp. BIGb0399]|nr:hypothetical protein EDF82_0899 [Raoultella sp. BIGb0399]